MNHTLLEGRTRCNTKMYALEIIFIILELIVPASVLTAVKDRMVGDLTNVANLQDKQLTPRNEKLSTARPYFCRCRGEILPIDTARRRPPHRDSSGKNNFWNPLRKQPHYIDYETHADLILSFDDGPVLPRKRPLQRRFPARRPLSIQPLSMRPLPRPPLSPVSNEVALLSSSFVHLSCGIYGVKQEQQATTGGEQLQLLI